MSNTERIPIPVSGWNSTAESIMATAKYFISRKKELGHKDFYPEAHLQFGLNKSSVNKVMRLAANPILSDPQYTNKLPPKWALLYELSFLPDDKLLDFLSGNAETISKYDIWQERKDRKRQRKSGVVFEHDQRATIRGAPEGISLTDHCRKGVELERTKGMPAPEAAASLGVGYQSYTKIKNVLALSDRQDLSDQDRSAVNDIIHQINRTRNIRRYYNRVKPIIERVWGVKRISKTGKAADRRIDAFKNAISIVDHACQKAMNLKPPYLSDDDTKSLLKELNEARRSVTKLMDNLRRANDE